MKTIDRSELDQWTRLQRSFALLDVLPREGGDAAEHMPHEHSEDDFLAQIAQLGDDKQQAVILYESSTASIPAGMAAGLLEGAGFGNVYQFVGPQAAFHGAAHASRTE